MNKLITTLLLIFILTLNAQQIDYNTDDGYVAEGYDVTEYFDNKAVEGKSSYITTKLKFPSQANLEKFKSNPIDAHI
ncbi:hypothetical protein [uncultured Aquimarina sp.]|uniref:hypothetical protein n=1 Tax=uncultured Aquimarina sp. TaxID=575652 RepID=UPI00260D4D0F|nr:hypothetical protein [uncultured Aquimarina sp.]